MATKAKKMSHLEFTEHSIKTLRNSGYKGIHTRYSGFNDAFRVYFPGEDPVAVTKALVADGKLASRFVRGGVMLYLPADFAEVKQADTQSRGNDALKKMGIAA